MSYRIFNWSEYNKGTYPPVRNLKIIFWVKKGLNQQKLALTEKKSGISVITLTCSVIEQDKLFSGASHFLCHILGFLLVQ
ncbi:MAG: hypothetical protein AAGE59_04265 [Cyanobacteria bacterium P01_F01_bin.86]